MSTIWKKKPVVGFGIGVGLLGAIALALRHRGRSNMREPIPDAISPAIFATRALSTSRGEVVYHICGSEQPVVFLHGFFLGASSYEWSKIYSRFAMSREVIAPDLIGFGESERPAEALDADAHVDSLSEFIRKVRPSRPVEIIASGLTCQIALLLAARHPELVGRLALFLPSNFQDSRNLRTLGFTTASRIPGLSRFAYDHYMARPHFIKTWLTRSGFLQPENVSEETVGILSTCAQQYGASHAILSLPNRRKNLTAASRLADVHAPVHIMWPGSASDFPADEGSALCRELPRGSMEILPECAPFAPLENPGALSESIARWLDGDLIAAASA
jgi:pimeloyl-ACP methyl ester carboxylesterase